MVFESRCSTEHVASTTAAKGPSYASSTKFAQCFQIAVKCWELLHQTDKLLRSSQKLFTSLRSEQWDWLPLFIIDALIYQRRYSEAYSKLSAVLIDSPKCPGLLLKLAGILFNLHDHHVSIPLFYIVCFVDSKSAFFLQNAIDQALRSVEMLAETKDACEPRAPFLPLPKV